MANNYLMNKNQKKSRGGLVMFLLFVSFIWTSIYSATSTLSVSFYYNFGNLIDTSSSNFPSIVISILTEALFCWLSFELVFYLYRYILQFKIYSFIVPQEKLKVDSRIFFIYRNIFYGLILNLCFLFPYLYEFATLFSLIATFATLIAYSLHLNKTYAEPIVGHFVFKNFCFPVFLYQTIILIFEIGGIL